MLLDKHKKKCDQLNDYSTTHRHNGIITWIMVALPNIGSKKNKIKSVMNVKIYNCGRDANSLWATMFCLRRPRFKKKKEREKKS